MSPMVIDLGSLIHNLPPEQKNAVRKLEKVSIKLCKSECREFFKRDVVISLKMMKLYQHSNRISIFSWY